MAGKTCGSAVSAESHEVKVWLSTSQRKIDREPDEIVRMLRALRNAISFLQSQREISAGLVEKLLKLDRPVAERFYALYREQFNPISRYPTLSLTNGFP
jgi:ABC-type nitrate/sulfonate/bicarbonate transport system substrate-binding protein